MSVYYPGRKFYGTTKINRNERHYNSPDQVRKDTNSDAVKVRPETSARYVAAYLLTLFPGAVFVITGQLPWLVAALSIAVLSYLLEKKKR